jgi:transcription initiation factor IIE alpha subunit
VKTAMLEQISVNILVNLPPSALAIYKIIESKKKVEVREIEKNTRYSQRTVRNALRILCNTNLIVKIPNIHDMRRHYYASNCV